jgi:hypothetical protein
MMRLRTRLKKLEQAPAFQPARPVALFLDVPNHEGALITLVGGKLVPETYRLRDEPVVFEGERVNLPQLLRGRQRDFIIKAQMESMGRDILIGREASPAEWESKLAAALDGPYVAQRFVEERPLELFDPEEPGRPIAMHYTLALFFLGGAVQGMYNRVSPGYVTNVARGGARQDVIVVERRGASRHVPAS